jgi:hypothetical protein
MHENFPSHELRTAMLISLKSSPDESRKSIKELFALMKKQESPVVIAIDEFQQILMTGLFTNPDRPFYRSTQFMKIGKLKKKTYREFILDKCRSGGRLLKEQEFVFSGTGKC